MMLSCYECSCADDTLISLQERSVGFEEVSSWMLWPSVPYECVSLASITTDIVETEFPYI